MSAGSFNTLVAAVKAADIAGKTLQAKTVEGQTLAINATSSAVKVSQATVSKADIVADNGVIHVIDAVVLPE